jgi:GT2 family glycosyltransferase
MSEVTTVTKQPEFDVLVITHGRLDLTIRCLDTLYIHTSNPFHVIVVDDSTDFTPMYLDKFAKEHDNMTYIHSDIPYKTGNQIFNIGFKHCKTPYMVTVMNSIRVEPEWDIASLQIMKANPKIGVLGFKCLFPNGLIESAGIRMVKWLPTDVGRDFPSHRLSAVYECDAAQWAFAMVRREAIEGTLEDNVFNGFKGWDDIDNCFVVKKNGYQVFYNGLAVGYHEPRATRGDNSKEAERLNSENGVTFMKRWGFWEEFCKQNAPGADVHTAPRPVTV